MIVVSINTIMRRPFSLYTIVYLPDACVFVYLCYIMVNGKYEAFLKKWLNEEDTKQLIENNSVSKNCLSRPAKRHLLSPPFLAEFREPETGAILPPFPVQLTEQPNQGMTLELMEETSMDLQNPGLSFQLYLKNGEPVTQEITLNLYSGHPDIFQAKFTISQGNFRLGKTPICS